MSEPFLDSVDRATADVLRRDYFHRLIICIRDMRSNEEGERSSC